MFGRLAGLAVFSAWLALPGAASAQSEGFGGQVETSPVPKVRVIRPSQPGDAIAAPQDQTPSTNDASGDASGPFGSDNGEQQDQPKVVRLVKPGDGGAQSSQDGQAGDGEWRNDRNQRFKKAPESSLSFKPDEGPPPIVPIRTPSTGLKEGARLRQLDKMTGQIQTYDVAVGETVRVARLQVRLDACRSPSGNDTHGTMAFLKIWDTKRETGDPEFSGWMFAESPALSALDHPRYDVWVINCTTPLGE